jgi:hypothetical protein
MGLHYIQNFNVQYYGFRIYYSPKLAIERQNLKLRTYYINYP